MTPSVLSCLTLLLLSLHGGVSADLRKCRHELSLWRSRVYH